MATSERCTFCHSTNTHVSSVQRRVIAEKTWYVRCDECGRLFDVAGAVDVLTGEDKQRVADIQARRERQKHKLAHLRQVMENLNDRTASDMAAVRVYRLESQIYKDTDFLLALIARLSGDGIE